MSLYYHLPSFIIIAEAVTTRTTPRGRTRTIKEFFSYAFKYLNSPETQRQYPRRLKIIFDYMGITGENLSSSLEARQRAFLVKPRKNPLWAQEKIIDFIFFHKQRVLRKEPTAGTLANSFLGIKLFC